MIPQNCWIHWDSFTARQMCLSWLCCLWNNRKRPDYFCRRFFFESFAVWANSTLMNAPWFLRLGLLPTLIWIERGTFRKHSSKIAGFALECRRKIYLKWRFTNFVNLHFKYILRLHFNDVLIIMWLTLFVKGPHCRRWLLHFHVSEPIGCE